jgi:predicted RNase H-like nuclease (RuvC/YqgF family)
MDKELKDFLDKKFSQVDENVDKKAEDVLRRFRIISENLDDKIKQVAEGVVNLSEKMDRLHKELRTEIQDSKQELAAAIKFSYADLDKRITSLEINLKELDDRVRRLESH